jgi:two-component system, response regulator PdtaR
MVPKTVAEPEPILARILIVEDEVLTRMVLAEELREAALGVIEAATADEAHSYLKSGEDVDLVFSDIRMPGAIDGLELERQLRIQYPCLPVLLTSANKGPEGSTLFIAKPYNMERLLSIIYKTLGLERSRSDA